MPTPCFSLFFYANVGNTFSSSKLFLLKLHSVHFIVVTLSFHHRDSLDKWVNGTCPYDSHVLVSNSGTNGPNFALQTVKFSGIQNFWLAFISAHYHIHQLNSGFWKTDRCPYRLRGVKSLSFAEEPLILGKDSPTVLEIPVWDNKKGQPNGHPY